MNQDVQSGNDNRAEKLASAIYLITSFFNEQEPIKWKLRTLVTDLATITASFKGHLFADKESVLLEVRGIISKISDLLSITKNAGLMSKVHYDLISTEFNKYVDNLDQPANLSEILRLESQRQKLKEPEVVLIKDKFKYLTVDKRQEPSESDKTSQTLKNFGAVSVKKNTRQSIIISLLKRKKEIMIKDVNSLITGCSDKTIQRELASMVQRGLLKRIGDKRWSRYSLV